MRYRVIRYGVPLIVGLLSRVAAGAFDNAALAWMCGWIGAVLAIAWWACYGEKVK